ncbi:type VII secretion protein EccCa [Micromonospora sp. NBC_01813]|uniref:type VII secretion protein EccCa n=1 Tax=Micromonospora sp. NBC_01813 TaxID=2975988 RepID=UPI002DD98E4E|nr:type VII secretion protein EccCa [Micromonospora sp. NBC_01813]WSA06763.1 type VII secretion protein EccCa [Micromonospora sp. NBC_01813]
MSRIVHLRSTRGPAPEMPTGEVRIAAPPELAQRTGGRWHQLFGLLPAAGGSVATAMMFGRGDGAYSYLVGAVFGASALAMMATSWSTAAGASSRSETDAARHRYLRHLADLRRQVRETTIRQRAAAGYRHPDPGRLWSTVASGRVWERRPADDDFGVVRIGVGPQPLATPLAPPVGRPADELEPLTAAALRRFLDTYAMVPHLPVAVALRSYARIHVTGQPTGGDQSPAAALARAVLAQLAVFHAPDDLRIAVCAAADRRHRWEWVKWLPHAGHPEHRDATGPVRMVVTAADELDKIIEPLLAGREAARQSAQPGPPPPPGVAALSVPPGVFDAGWSGTTGPHLVVVLDGAGFRRDLAGVTVIELGTVAPRVLGPAALELAVDPAGRLSVRDRDEPTDLGEADQLGVVEVEALARQLAPLRLAGAGTPVSSGPAAEPDLIRLLESDPAVRWWSVTGPGRGPAAQRQLRVPIGVDAAGGPVELDLKESSLQGMGPHGLVVGATGSGKSELLRTLVLGLALTHPPEALNVVLVDFKGGATFASLDRLPHTAAVITNLAQELPLVDRMADSLTGELIRRQNLLRQAGNLASRQDYLRARATNDALPPLPALLVICDEFTELLTAKPDFIDVFLQIGRVGRSLGVHLVLASQRVDEGRLRGLDTHLSYRIGLRTFSALESRAILGVPDAYQLPGDPGHGFLRYGTDPPVRFRAAYVSGPYRRPVPRRPAQRRPTPGIHEFRTSPTAVPPAAPQAGPRPAQPVGPEVSLLAVTVDRLARHGPPAHRVWLPPLDSAPSLDDLLGPVREVPGRGLAARDPALAGRLRVPVALVDKPSEQRRDPLWLSLHAAAGHVATIGAPQSGKSQLIRTLICALALTHTPVEVQVYCLDFGGGTLAALRELPHVGGVALRAEPAAVRRTVAEVANLLAVRERRFAELGVESIADYRVRRADGSLAGGDGPDAEGHHSHPPDDPYGDVFLVVDGWPTLRGEYDELESTVIDLATRGLSYGVHLVASAPRWTDLRPALRDLFGSRLELRLGDPIDSSVSRRSAGNVPEQPGRGITSDGFHFLGALAEVSTVHPVRPGLTSGTAALVAAVADRWPGPAAPAVRLLPDLLPYPDLDRSGTDGLRLPIGVTEADLRPVSVDFATDPHLLLFGDAESGKSSFLRAVAATIAGRFAPEQARMIMVDYRRGLLDAVTSAHLIGYGSTAAHATELIESAAGYLRERLPGPEVTAEQLADRSWWTGPELFVLVDDYDLVCDGTNNPVQPLVEFLAHARDIGLHLVLARRCAGAARALYEPVVQRLRELSTAALVLSGDRDEGQLVGGVRPGPLPPGRGQLVTRREGARLVQLAYLPVGGPDPTTSLRKTASTGGKSR